MTSKIVFTGITGLLGGYFLKKKQPRYEVIGISSKDFDVTDKKKVIDFINKINPAVIVHAASLGNVDYCEKHPDEAIKVNVEGTKNIIEATKRVKGKIIFLSSNAIYDGENPPYHEESRPNPIDVYGKTKAKGEKLVKESNLDFVIVRLITMYGWPQVGGRANPVSWIIENLKKGERISVVSDIFNNHLYAASAAAVLWKIIEKNIKRDVYNIAGADNISRYDLALKVAEIFKLDPSLITPVSSSFFKNIAKRPRDTSFNTKKMEKKLGIKPLSIDEGLRLMREEATS